MKVRVPAITIASVMLLGVAGGAARAGGFADGEVGIASPLGDNDYDNGFDASPKIGVHIGSWLHEQDHVLMGVELGADLTFLDGPSIANVDTSYHRVRALAGLRLAYDVSKMIRVSARMAVGADYTRFHASSTILTPESTESNLGLAIDPSVALQLHLGGGSYGVQLGIPVGTHNGKGNDALVNYTSYDFDFMFVATADVD